VTVPQTPPRLDPAPPAQQAGGPVQRGLLALVVLVALVVGVPELVASARTGSVDLATVFYPVVLVSAGLLAWTRRTGS
jgi:hypothetical protein